MAILIWMYKNILSLLTILAILLSPLITLRIEKKLNDNDRKEKRKHDIFETLFSTRATPLAPEHVNALNGIDIAFYHNKEIKNSWKIYRDHFDSCPKTPAQSLQEQWENKRQELFTDLLYAMSLYFKYDFDKVTLKKGVYFPQGHSTFFMQQEQIRLGVINFLNGKSEVPVRLVNPHS